MKELIKQDCLSCVYLNVNGTCGNRRSVMYGVITTKPSYPPNCAMTEGTTTRKPLRNTRENVKYKAYTTMNKLIEEAESLYKQIDKAQVHLVNARLNNDEEGKKSAISEMETAMCNTMQLLKCFIEYKGNIVDLSEIWHDITEEPKLGAWLVGQIGETAYDTFISAIEGKRMSELFDGYNIKRWAYIKYLLPKGGEE